MNYKVPYIKQRQWNGNIKNGNKYGHMMTLDI